MHARTALLRSAAFPPTWERKNAPALVPEVKAALDAFVAANKAELDKLRAEIKAETERADELEKRFNRQQFGGGFRRENGDAAAEHKAIGAFIKTGDDAELKGLSVGEDPAGGYLVLPNHSTVIQGKLKDSVAMRRLARIETIDQGDAWVEPWDNEDVGAEWVGETEARPETTNPTPLRTLTVPLAEIYAHQTITQKLLDTSFANIGNWIEGKISDKFGRKEGADFINGNGVKKPMGLFAYSTEATADASRAWAKWQHVVSGSATAVTADSLRDLYWTVRAPYRQNASWLMASSSANAIDKLKDGNGDYLWRDGMTAGAPPTLLGRPVEFDENMPAIAGNALPIAFGDFRRGYLIVDMSGVKFLRDPYSNKPNVVFYAYRRVGGGGADFDAIKFLKIST